MVHSAGATKRKGANVSNGVAWIFLALVSVIGGSACFDIEDDDSRSSRTGGGSDSSGTSSSGSHPYWARADGQRRAQLYLSGSVAKACTPDFAETIGTFNGSSMTFVIQGERLTFPLDFDGNNLWVGVPEQSTATHDGAPYVRSATYDCSGSSSGGSNGGNSNGGNSNGGNGGGGDEIPPNNCRVFPSPYCEGSHPYSCDDSDSCYMSVRDCATDPACRR